MTTAAAIEPHDKRAALRFIILIGILSFFADFTYEGSRSIIGPYLATLQATGSHRRHRHRFRRAAGLRSSAVLRALGGRDRPLLADHHLRLRRADGRGAGAGAHRQLAGRGGADHPRTRRQGDPQPATRRDALARGQAGRRLRLGIRTARGARSVRRHVRSARGGRGAGARRQLSRGLCGAAGTGGHQFEPRLARSLAVSEAAGHGDTRPRRSAARVCRASSGSTCWAPSWSPPASRIIRSSRSISPAARQSRAIGSRSSTRSPWR